MRTALMIVLAGLSATAAGLTPMTAKAANQCFRLNDWQGWKAVDERAINIRVGVRDVYRIGFAQTCPRVTFPGVHLVTTGRPGGNLICSPIDLDVKVGDTGPAGFSTPCIVNSITKLTPEEVKALPKKQIP